MEKRAGKHKAHAKRHKGIHGGTGDAHDNEESVDEIPETQEAASVSQQHSNNNQLSDKGSTSGIIESVLLKDFMCHNRLEFRFGENVNFVVGRNGSGKSAILTAVVVALGGKATTTSRGNSLRNFIRKGRREAKVVVRLCNRGTDTYKPEEYGSQIVIERRLTLEGGSTYRILSKDGRVVSTKREELLHILDHFNIQVDNPMTVLNQEVSRNFLNSKNSRDKYSFFLKATQLEQLKNEYMLTEEQKRIAEGLLQAKKENVAFLKQELKEWERKREFLDSLEKQHEKLHKLRCALLWSHVKYDEESLLDKRSELEQAKSQVTACKTKVEEFVNTVKGLSCDRDQIRSDVEAASEMMRAIHPQLESTKVALLELKSQFRVKHLEARKHNNTIESIKRDEDELKRRIEELRAVGQKDYATERQERLDKIEQLELKKERMVAREKSTSVHHDQLKSSIGKIQEEVHSLTQELKEKQQQLDVIQSQIRNLEASRTDHLRKFGSYIPELRRAIDNAFQQRKFRQKPRGPIGAGITLKDQKWAVAVEACIRGLMTAFCCDNHQDERVLEQLMRDIIRQGAKPSIIVSEFNTQVYDVSEHAAKSDEHPTVLDMLEISDPVVANCLIDQRAIECVLLIANNKEARMAMLHNVPRNCRETFTHSGDQIYAAPRFRYYSSNQKNPEFLHRDLGEQIRQKQLELGEVRRQQSELVEKIKHSKSLLKTHMEELQETERDVSTIRKSIMDLSVQIMELKNAEEPEPVDVTVLEEELNSFAVKRQKLTDQYSCQQYELEQLKEAVKQKGIECKELEGTISSMMGSIEPLKEKLHETETKIQETQERKKHYDARLHELELQCKRLDREYEQQFKALQQKMSQAERVSPRVESTSTIHVLESKVKALEEHLKKEEENQGCRENVLEKVVELKTKYDSVMKQIEKLENFLEVLSNALQQRSVAFCSFRQQLTLRTKLVFINALSQRHFLGKLIFDHKKETLEILIFPGNKSDAHLHETHSLSGGERSFTTVSLITAMWEATESPFRILDEFDVFMDMVTRRVSLDMMMTTAMQKRKCQFVFLTPLGMPTVPYTNLVRIFQMPDPDRNQSCLMFTSQDEEQGEQS